MVQVSKNEKRLIEAKCPGLGFVRTRHRLFMEERADGQKQLRILRNTGIRSWKTARITACMLVVMFLLMLTGCSKQAVTVYADDCLTVTRQGHNTTVVDVLTGEEYHYTTRRVKRSKNATEAQQRAVCRTLTDTDTLTVMTAQNVLFIVEKSGARHIMIKTK